MHRNLKISVVIPCYNEENGLPATFKLIPSYIDEVIVIDNNSTDQTAKIARDFGARVINETNQGYGYAYQRGLKEARGDIIITGDADGTYPIHKAAEIIDFLLENNFDFISCNRLPLKNPQSMEFINLLGNHLLNLTMSLLVKKWIRDSQSGMWVFKREILPKLNLTSGDMALSEEIKMEAIFHPEINFTEYHIDYYKRAGDTKLIRWKHGFKNLIFLPKKYWQIKRRKGSKKR